jgi:transcriptional regulator of aromatic amino acid metabolism
VFNFNRPNRPYQRNVRNRARFMVGIVLALFISGNVGCFLPIYDADPAVRARQLINTSEDLRALREQWQRFWFLDQPSHMTPTRTHGGIL